MHRTPLGPLARLTCSTVVAVAVVTAALVLPGDTTGRGGTPVLAGGMQTYSDLVKQTQGLPHHAVAGAPPTAYEDERTRNAISRSIDPATVDAVEADDPTTPLQRAIARGYVERERAMADPELRGVPLRAPRRLHPQNRYALAGGCYRLTPSSGPLFFQATDLGRYLLYTPDRRFVGSGGEIVDAPADDTVWTVRPAGGGRYTFTQTAGGASSTPLSIAGRTALLPTRATGCTAYPESQVNVQGDPTGGVTPFQEVRGYVDAHTHGMAFEFLGGHAHCGKPWDRFGAPYALVDCPDHTATGGYGAVLEAILSGKPSHDPVGWPTFKDWPAPYSLTHEGTYYKWMERAWRGGLRLFTNLLVENNQLCQIYSSLYAPLDHNSCDDMDSVRLQARDMYAFQDYIDAQWGGPGKGWYRIVKNPFEARRVINAGKMAVIMGIETSVPFGCTFKRTPLRGDVPACSADDIDRQVAEVHRMGVRQMELVNKFDNALSGIAGDNGSTGVLVNGANFLETGTFWDMRHCEPADGESSDHDQYAAPDITAGQQDALFGAVAQVAGLASLPALPFYPPAPHCNARGLTTLGEHTIDQLIKRKMVFDPDHMSVKARNEALDHIETTGYHGIVSSHSWSTPDAYPRIYEMGGFITPYAGDSTGFVDKWRRHVGWADPRYYFGMGYGADINGLGAQGNPRGADAKNPVTYPFTGLGGVRIDRQVSGERVFDINVDGVAQYGLYPDWIEDIAHVADSVDPQDGDGTAITEDMTRGAEAYLQMWERAYGIAPDSCRNPGNRQQVDAVRRALRPGMSTTAVMRAVGQPYTRLGRTFGFCARTSSDPKVLMTATFDRGGHLLAVRS